MLNWWESFILAAVLGLLQKYIKNPASVAEEKVVITEIYNLSGELLAGLGGAPAPTELTASRTKAVAAWPARK